MLMKDTIAITDHLSIPSTSGAVTFDLTFLCLCTRSKVIKCILHKMTEISLSCAKYSLLYIIFRL